MSPVDKKITVVGAGYVGLTLAAVLSNVGYKTFILDKNEEKVEAIKRGKVPFYEPGLESFIKNGLENGNLLPTSRYEECVSESDIIFICVGTPSNQDGSISLENVNGAVESVCKNGKKDLIIVQKSTVPVGTGNHLKNIISKKSEENPKISLIVSPEFLREGSAIYDTLFPERIVIGGGNGETEALLTIYKEIEKFGQSCSLEGLGDYAFVYRDKGGGEKMNPIDERIIKTSIESAEMIKMTANSFLAMKISFANAVARMCGKTGASTKDVMKGLGSDSRIGSDFLYPGLGYGGGCFAKDVSGMIRLADALDTDIGILDAVKKINDTQVYVALDKIKGLLGGELNGKKVAFLGLSFKPGSSDVRESMALRLLRKVLQEGMEVKAYDPKARIEVTSFMNDERLKVVDEMGEVFNEADIVVLATGWKDFLAFDYSKVVGDMSQLNFFDGRGVMDMDGLEKLGFRVDSF